MVLFLLAVIAVGVLLLSEAGRTILAAVFFLACVVLILGIIGAACLVAWWAIEHWKLQETLTLGLTLVGCFILLSGFVAVVDRCRAWWTVRKAKDIET
jgi:hypothetical protein